MGMILPNVKAFMFKALLKRKFPINRSSTHNHFRL